MVDEKGNPIANAYVAMTDYKPPHNAFDWIILGDATDANGKFEISTYTKANEIETYQFVSSPVASNAGSPINAPFTILHQQNPASRGKSITLKKDKDLDIGDIKIQVWFGLVELFVCGRDGKPFYKNRDDWSDFIYLARNGKGNFASA